MTQPLRCAIYTRKSSEEGLEQNFNSLHAQREACEAYVLSQAGEGWTLMAGDYDDGGFSGGSMDRPGLQALLGAIRRGEIDIVVVYKVDRLTRSLADFARMVELFDQYKVSFVSVTQAFNTTTSMGRLTLNVLLSFAQFEREVTGERIRDKIAASKAKGLWMGGRPPLGYDGVNRKLVVNAAEAALVRRIFERYLELGTVTALTLELKETGVRSKRWTMRNGELAGGAIFTRGALYHLLSNPTYRDAIRHRDHVYDGAHPAIVDDALWDRVQAMLAANANDAPQSGKAAAPPLLEGRLFDDRGNRMGPLHTQRRGRRYRYYVSAALKPASSVTAGSLPRIAMGVLDEFIVTRLAPILASHWRPDLPDAERLAPAIIQVRVGAERIEALLAPESLLASAQIDGATFRTLDEGVEIAFDVHLKHRQGALILDGPGAPNERGKVDRALVRALALSRSWAQRLARGDTRTTKDIAREEGLCDHYTAKLMPLAFLAPDLAEMILEGRQPRALTLAVLMRQPLPLDWTAQRRQLVEIG